MQTTLKPVLSIYVNNNGTLFCLVYKNRTVEKSLPIDLFYLTYEDEKTAREAADMLFSDLDVRNEIIEKAEKRYKIEKEEKSLGLTYLINHPTDHFFLFRKFGK